MPDPQWMVEAQGGWTQAVLSNELGQWAAEKAKIHQHQPATFTLVNPENSRNVLDNGIVEKNENKQTVQWQRVCHLQSMSKLYDKQTK